jgi:hypothetical protein
MKIKRLSLIALLLTITSAGLAQTRSASPDTIVKNLYAAHKAKRGPFFQTRSRARIDQYFTRELAKAIWKDAVESKGEVGALGFDPLFNAQDVRITRFKVAKPMYGEGNLNVADVAVTFRNHGTAETVLFRLERDKAKRWRIGNISYPSNGLSLVSIYADNAGAGDASATEIDGQLHRGRTSSYILYFGPQSGDYAAYCFDNNSDVGRSILAACKDGDQCRVKGEITDDAACKAPGLEADLSARGRIVKINSVKSLGKQR